MEKDNNKFDVSNQTNNGRGGLFKIKGFGLFIAIFWAFFLASALSNVVSPYFASILNGLLTGITSLIIGIFLGFIFSRFVDFMEKKVMKNLFKNSPYKFAIKRTISICLVLVILALIVALVMSILVPKIIEIIEKLTAGGGDGGTQIYNNVVNEICSTIQKWFGAEVSQESIKNILTSIFAWFLETVGYLNNLLEISLSLATGLLNVIMGLVFTVLILKDKEKISRYTHRYTYTHFKKEKADELCVMGKNASDILYNYAISKLIEFAVIFVSLGIAFVALGLEFTWELSLIIGLFNFIPYFGIYIGTVPCVLITLIFESSIDAALYMILAILIITTIIGWTISPFIAGKKLKVSSLVVLGSIVIGGAMFGILGMLFAPPIAALISVVVTGNIELRENRMKFVMELKEVREKNEQEEKEQLGLMPLEEEKKVDEFDKEIKKDDSNLEKAKKNIDIVDVKVEKEEKEKKPTNKRKTTKNVGSKSTKKKSVNKKNVNKKNDRIENKIEDSNGK